MKNESLYHLKDSRKTVKFILSINFIFIALTEDDFQRIMYNVEQVRNIFHLEIFCR